MLDETIHGPKSGKSGICHSEGETSKKCDVIPVRSIAEVVGDDRLKTIRCYVCRAPIFVRKATPHKKICAFCAEPHEKAKRTAMRIVHIAIKAGFLLPATKHACVDCGKPAQCYDHREYRRALDVDPVCTSCNFKRGPASWSKTPPSQEPHRPPQSTPPSVSAPSRRSDIGVGTSRDAVSEVL